MKTLFLVRHAQAADFGYIDQERPLTDFGKQSAIKLGIWLHQNQKIVQRIVTSSALRTIQTADLIAQNSGFEKKNIRIEDRLYETSAEILEDYIFDLPPELDSVLIINHNPAISLLAKHLIGSSVPFFSPAGFVEIGLVSWKKIGRQEGILKNMQP